MQTKPYNVSELAGSGKTHHLSKAILTGIYGEVLLESSRLIYIAPSIELGHEFASSVKTLSPSTTIHHIHSDAKKASEGNGTYVANVRIAAHEISTSTPHPFKKEILIVTHDTGWKLTADEAKDWVVAHDEILWTHQMFPITFSSSKDMSTFEDIFDYDENTKRITVRADKVHVSDRSGISSKIVQVIEMIISQRFRAYLYKIQEKKYNIVMIPDRANFYIGKQFFWLGANSNYHPLGETIPNYIHLDGANKNHESDRIHLHYCYETTQNTRFLRENHQEYFHNAFIACVNHASTVKNEYSILSSLNKKEEEAYKEYEDSGKIKFLPWNTQGLDQFKDSNCVILLASQNIDPELKGFLIEFCGITEEQLDWERKCDTLYQRAMRCAIRMYKELDQDVHLYVFSNNEADILKSYFPNAKVDKIGNLVDKPAREYTGRRVGSVNKVVKEKMSPAEYKRLSRFKKTLTDSPEKYSAFDMCKITLALEMKGKKAYNQLVSLGHIIEGKQK